VLLGKIPVICSFMWLEVSRMEFTELFEEVMLEDTTAEKYGAVGALLAFLMLYEENEIKPKILYWTDLMISGEISLAEWQERLSVLLKDLFLVAGTLGRGTTLSIFEISILESQLRETYRYLDKFAWEVRQGLLSIREIRARVLLYSSSYIPSFWEMVREQEKSSQMTVERRVLHPAEHCKSCVRYAQEGWKPLGYFPPPGSGSECGTHCRCTMEFQEEGGR
jgi:hypothetical protein